MSALAVDRAIRRRFAEAYRTIPGLRTLDNDPFPERTNTSFLAGIGEQNPHCQPLGLEMPRGSQEIERVWVFLENDDGHHHDIAHHVSFQNIRYRWREEEGATGRDCIGIGTTQTVNSQGEVVSGPDMIIERPQAQPESLYYDFHVVSRLYPFAQEILGVVLDLFPMHGHLDIEFRDGSIHPVDMIRRVNPFRSSTFDATLEPGDPGIRRYRWTVQYEVESYTDNTLQGVPRQTIKSTCAPHEVDLLPRE